MASIAVSALVRPSRMLAGGVALMCVAIGIVAYVVGTGAVGELSGLSRSVLGALCWVATFFVFYRFISSQRTYHIDISGIGQIRLSEYSHLGGSREASPVRLIESTLWPMLMILRFRQGGREHVLRILPDSVPVDAFRALSVACRWIAAHNHGAQDSPI